jgi:hypothetical protein
MQDRGADINISIPSDAKVCPATQTAFADGGLIDWSKPYLFPATDREVSRMIMEISAFVKGNMTRVYPCYMFYIEPSNAVAYELP